MTKHLYRATRLALVCLLSGCAHSPAADEEQDTSSAADERGSESDDEKEQSDDDTEDNSEDDDDTTAMRGDAGAQASARDAGSSTARPASEGGATSPSMCMVASDCTQQCTAPAMPCCRTNSTCGCSRIPAAYCL